MSARPRKSSGSREGARRAVLRCQLGHAAEPSIAEPAASAPTTAPSTGTHSASRAGRVSVDEPVFALPLVMRDGHDLDGVLGTSLVHDGVRKFGHHVIVHESIGREALNERPALRRFRDGVESCADGVQETRADVRSFGLGVVVASTFANVGTRLPGNKEIQATGSGGDCSRFPGALPAKKGSRHVLLRYHGPAARVP